MQSQGRTTNKSHNLLSAEYVVNLYVSDMPSKDGPLRFFTRFIFNFAIATSWRPRILYTLDVSNVFLTKHRGTGIWRITNRIAIPNGSKTAQGGLSSLNYEPMTVTIRRKEQLDGTVFVFDDISEYIQMTTDPHKQKSKFFLSKIIFGNLLQLIGKSMCGRIKERFSKRLMSN